MGKIFRSVVWRELENFDFGGEILRCLLRCSKKTRKVLRRGALRRLLRYPKKTWIFWLRRRNFEKFAPLSEDNSKILTSEEKFCGVCSIVQRKLKNIWLTSKNFEALFPFSEENSKFLISEGETLSCILVSALYTLNVVLKVEYAHFEDRYNEVFQTKLLARSSSLWRIAVTADVYWQNVGVVSMNYVFGDYCSWLKWVGNDGVILGKCVELSCFYCVYNTPVGFCVTLRIPIGG